MIVPRLKLGDGGKTPPKPKTAKPKKNRNSLGYRQWRKLVLLRDEHRCQMCGETRELQVHHIIRYVDNKALQTNLANGIALCCRCHTKVTANEKIYETQFIEIARANYVKNREIVESSYRL